MKLAGQRTLGALVLVGLCTVSARAQSFEQSGVRAQGMAGAFAAVADDASAVWWNPAGLAGGPFFNLLVEHAQQPESGTRVDGFALATPPLGLSYQRLSGLVSVEGQEPNGRETGSGAPYFSTLVAHVAGVTLLHSVTTGFVVGSTLKFVHADVDGLGTNRGDLDVAVHYRVRSIRTALVIRNVTQPSFRSPDGGEVTAQREVRAGGAWTASEATTLAADVDLTDVGGQWPGRRVSVGAEQRFGQRLAARGGVRIRTTDGPDPWVSVGGSYAVTSGIWLDGFWGNSPDQTSRWGLSVRLAY